MALSAKSSLKEFSITVGSALRAQGIRAVLTGGACASIYTGGKYMSGDADFILRGRVDRRALDEALHRLGFGREGDRYVHRSSRFFVEFPAGPLAIGGDVNIEPVEIRLRDKVALALSATDSCRDRLSGYFHWQDRESLAVAIEIAVRNEIDWHAVKSWSEKEGAIEGFEDFQDQAQAVRRGRNRGKG